MAPIVVGPDQALYQEIIPGREDRPVLVFLHEGLGSIGQWRDFPEQLCQRTRCPGLLYDRIGHGRSSPCAQKRTIHYLHAHALVELPRVVHHSIAGKPYFLIGHSDGGSIALIAGAEQSPQLRGIITMAAHIMVEACTLEGIEKAEHAYNQGQLRQLLWRYHGEQTDTLFHSWADTWTSGWFRFWNIEYLLPAIEAPLLVLQGREDQYGTRTQVEQIVARSGGAATPLLLEDCGHAPHLEFPELCLDLLACFINRHGRE